MSDSTPARQLAAIRIATVSVTLAALQHCEKKLTGDCDGGRCAGVFMGMLPGRNEPANDYGANAMYVRSWHEWSLLLAPL